MAEIILTQGRVALVDDSDFEWLSQWKWHVFKGCSGHVYAARNGPPDNTGRRAHIFMHRVLVEPPAGLIVDHINGNGLDNQRANLRVADTTRNMWNRAPNRSGSSTHKGVYWHKQHSKWVAAIQVEKKRRHLGLFQSEAEAAAAYRRAAVAAHGRFYRSAEQ